MLKVILTHIGGEPPPYMKECLRQFRIFNPEAPVALIGARKYLEQDREFLRETKVEPVFSEELESDPRILAFRRRNWFKGLGTPETSFPSQPGFWQYTTERLFFVASLMARDRLENVFHFENDVLIYRDLREVLAGIGRGGKKGMYVTPVGRHWVSCGLLYVDHASSLAQFCDFVLEATSKKPRQLEREFGLDMVNDMTLLKIFGDRAGTLNYFPVLPEGEHAHGVDAFGAIFDGASWGQFLGGTNNGAPPGWASEQHYVGREILQGNYKLCWEGHESKTPFAVDRNGHKTRVNNLHIHSKNLGAFTSGQAVPPESPRVHCQSDRPAGAPPGIIQAAHRLFRGAGRRMKAVVRKIGRR